MLVLFAAVVSNPDHCLYRATGDGESRQRVSVARELIAKAAGPDLRRRNFVVFSVMQFERAPNETRTSDTSGEFAGTRCRTQRGNRENAIIAGPIGSRQIEHRRRRRRWRRAAASALPTAHPAGVQFEAVAESDNHELRG